MRNRFLISMLILASGTCAAQDFKPGSTTRIEYQSVNVPSRWHYIRMNTNQDKPQKVYGDLVMPQSLKPGDKVPLVIISHGSGGVWEPEYEVWAASFAKAGYASFVVDSFKPRGVTNTTTNQALVTYSSGLADALYALKTLSTYPQIDAKRVFHIGFSRGGTAAFESAWPSWIRPVLKDSGLKFAGNIALYPGACNVRYRTDDREKANGPILKLLADRDLEDYQGTQQCVEYAEDLAKKGNDVQYKEYKGAYHAFDSYSKYRVELGVWSGKGCDIDLFMTLKQGGDAGEGFDRRTNTKFNSYADFNKAAEVCGQSRPVNARVGGDPKFRELAVRDVLEFINRVLKANP